MLTEILISFGIIAVGFATAIVALLLGILLITLAEKIADSMKNNMGYKKFNNIKRITIIFFFVLIMIYVVYALLFTN